MSDEGPIDLQLLEPEDTPDVVKGAIRRFRWRVVLLTVVAVVVAASLAGWTISELLASRRVAEAIAEAEPAKRAIMEDHGGAYACDTPTFELGGFEVALLRAVPMPDGGWALHLVVHGERLASGTGRFMVFVPIGPAARAVQIPAQPGATWADAFVSTPSSLGDRFDIQLRDLHGELMGTFTVNTADLNCDFS
jgi:hypothetical protein